MRTKINRRHLQSVYLDEYDRQIQALSCQKILRGPSIKDIVSGTGDAAVYHELSSKIADLRISKHRLILLS